MKTWIATCYLEGGYWIVFFKSGYKQTAKYYAKDHRHEWVVRPEYVRVKTSESKKVFKAK